MADADSPLDATREWTLDEVAAWWQLQEPEEEIELDADNLQSHVRWGLSCFVTLARNARLVVRLGEFTLTVDRRPTEIDYLVTPTPPRSDRARWNGNSDRLFLKNLADPGDDGPWTEERVRAWEAEVMAELAEVYSDEVYAVLTVLSEEFGATVATVSTSSHPEPGAEASGVGSR
ncbi:MAG TPA: hypothetical protein GXZ30_09275 [Propionibacterium sp.]|nr:hypothetical protein [Propionibacterium sp.]